MKEMTSTNLEQAMPMFTEYSTGQVDNYNQWLRFEKLQT